MTPEQRRQYENIQDITARVKCRCDDCDDIRSALDALDDIASTVDGVAWNDVDRLENARALLARVIGRRLDNVTNRYVDAIDVLHRAHPVDWDYLDDRY